MAEIAQGLRDAEPLPPDRPREGFRVTKYAGRLLLAIVLLGVVAAVLRLFW